MQEISPYTNNPKGPPPENNMVWAILCTVMCCMPLGIYAIIKAAEVETKWNAGDEAGAIQSAKEAKQWSIYGALIVAVIFIFYLFISFIIPFGIFLLTAIIPLLSNL